MPGVLMFCFLFPPLGGAGVQRTLKFIKYLPAHGWRPLTLSAQPLPPGPLDPDLCQEIPAEVKQFTCSGWRLPPRLPWRVRSAITRWLLLDEHLGWLPFAIRRGRQIIQAERPAALYSTSAPVTDHLAARRLAAEFHLPWVADFRDPWVGNFSSQFATPLHALLAQSQERKIVRQADAVLVVSDPMRQTFRRRYPETPETKFAVIPNGFDPSDFAEPAADLSSPGKFTLVYTGSLYGQKQRATHLLQALRQAAAENPDLGQHVRLRLVGNLNKPSIDEIAASGLSDLVEVTGYLPHHQAIQQMRSADVLVLLIGSGPGSDVVFTGKIFEYLAAQKPVLCLAPAGAAADLVRQARAGQVVSPEDTGAIAAALIDLFKRWQAGTLAIQPDLQVIQGFDRRGQAARLAEILNSIVKENTP